MGLPNSREITAAPNTDIPSAAFNAMQDAIIGGKHPEFEFPIHVSGFKNVGANAPVYLGNYDQPGAGGSLWEASIPVRVGQRITKVRVRYRRSSGAGDMSIGVDEDDAVGAGSVLGTHTDSVHDGTDQVYDLAINYVALADHSYRVNVSIGDNTGPGRFYSVSWFADRQ